MTYILIDLTVSYFNPKFAYNKIIKKLTLLWVKLYYKNYAKFKILSKVSKNLKEILLFIMYNL